MNVDIQIQGEFVRSRLTCLLNAGGWNGFLRTLFMLVAAVGIAIAEYVLFREMYCGSIAIILTILGWLFRRTIMELGKDYSTYSRRILAIYGLILFLTSRAGVGVQAQLVIIAVACTVMFNLNFWSITEAAVEGQQHS